MAKNYNSKTDENRRKQNESSGKARGNVRDEKDTKEYKSAVKKEEK